MTIELIPTRDGAGQSVINGDDGKEVIPREDVEKSFNAAGAAVLNIVSDGLAVWHWKKVVRS